jgi:hypothetical protein
MNKNSQVFKASLTTKGRKTGKDHSVLLRAVQYNDRIYFSRLKSDGDWFQNAIVNPQVKVEFSNTSYSGNAIRITDEELAKKISLLKYPGEQRANEKRVVLQVTLCEQL